MEKMDFEFKNKRVAFYIIHSLERFSCPVGAELKSFFLHIIGTVW